MIDLRAARLNRGLSVKAAADAIGISRDTLERAEGRRTHPHPANALKIAQFYGHQVTDIWPLDSEATGAAA